MYTPGAIELLIILFVLGCPALAVILIVAAVRRREKSQGELAAQLDRIERKLNEKAEE